MKRIFIFILAALPVLAFSQARYDIIQMPLCWTVGAGDSSITRYVLVSSTGAYSTVMYLNAAGNQINYTSGTLRNGHCDCCTGGSGSGTVTNVATGVGLTGGPITTTGTIAVDTAVLATRFYANSKVDSTRLVQDSVLVYYTGGAELRRDTISSGSGGSGSGTVTNVATGVGLTGGPITTTGTIAVDTAVLASKTFVTTRGYITSEVDGSITNEGILGTAQFSTVAATISTNTSTGNPIYVVANDATGIGLTATNSSNGGQIQIRNDTTIVATRAHVLQQTKLKFETVAAGVKLSSNATNSVTMENGPGLVFVSTDSTKMFAFVQETIIIACSDETSNLTTGNAKVTFRAPYKFIINDVRLNVNTAPTGNTILVDINNSGSTIFTTRPSIDANEKTSTTAATPYVIGSPYVLDDQELTINIDQIGSTVAGKGLKVHLTITRMP